MPTKREIDNLLIQQEATIRNNLKILLSKQDKVCTTADAWKSRGRDFLGMTVNFICPETLERKSYMLAFKALKRRQTTILVG